MTVMMSSRQQCEQEDQKEYVPMPEFWFNVSLCILFVVAAQSLTTLPGRWYCDNGGESKLFATLVFFLCFPLFIPYNGIARLQNYPSIPDLKRLALVCIPLNILVAGDCYLYSIGWLYLPLSTFSILCASHVVFNAIFSHFFLDNNPNKFTPFIVTSLALIATSSTLMGFSEGLSKGFICTMLASAGYGLALPLTQLCFKKHINATAPDVVLVVSICKGIVGLCFWLAALVWNGEEMPQPNYMVVVAMAHGSWEIYCIGAIGLIGDLSVLFAKTITALGLPLVLILAVIHFHDQIDGIKATSMMLAICSFLFYIYQEYLDDQKLSSSKSSDIAIDTEKT